MRRFIPSLGGLIVILLAVGLIVGWALLPSCHYKESTEEKIEEFSITGIVKSVEHIADPWTIVRFEDGTVVSFTGITRHPIQVGRRNIIYYRIFNGRNFIIRVEMIDIN